MESTATVKLVGEWLELNFDHDLRVAHKLRSMSGRRLRLGLWRVPISEAGALARELANLDFAWEGEAAALRHRVLIDQERLMGEDQLATRIKAGESVLGDWSSPVALLAHQRAGVEFLAARSGALLCDEQGLGKTLTCLVAFWLLRERDEAKRLVVVCPNSLKHNWRAESAKFFPEWRVTVVEGQKRRRVSLYKEVTDICVVNYESVRSDYADLRLLLRQTPTILACDESHSAKNATSRTAKALGFVRSAASRIWVMSGTPIPNGLEDAYSQVTLADGGRLFGTKEAFINRYGKREDPEVAAEELRGQLEPILLRRTKEQVLDLPEKVFEDRYVELQGEQLRLYEAIRTDLLAEATTLSAEEFQKIQANFLVRLLRLSQVAANPRLVDPAFSGVSAKTAEIDQLLEDLIAANGRKVVLWSYYVGTIKEMIERYRAYNAVAIFGAVPTPDRALAVDRFQNDPETKLFIGNPQAAGTGLTLTSAHFAIYESLTWRYDLYAQSLDRIHRIGQDRSVTYFTVLAEGTVELDVVENLRRKQELAAGVLGDGAAPAPLKQDEVVAMLSRRPS